MPSTREILAKAYDKATKKKKKKRVKGTIPKGKKKEVAEEMTA